MHQAALRQLWKGFSYYQHQVQAVNWMIDKEMSGTVFEGKQLLGGLLADDMGLGKTIEITGLICETALPTTLLIVPIALMDQWISVLTAANLSTWRAEKGRWLPASDTLLESPRPTNVFIMNYEKLYTSCFSLIKGTHFDRIILDEAHRIRSPLSAAAVVLKTISAPRRWAVTGTPIVNSLKDVVSLFRFIGLERKTSRWESDFIELGAELTLRRSLPQMRGVLSDAPPEPVIHNIVLDFATTAEAEFYRKVQDTLSAHDDTPANTLTAIMRMRQISVHPQIYIDSRRAANPKYPRANWNQPVTKFEAVKEILSGASGNNKYIFVCHFSREIELLRSYLEENRLVDNVYTYDGTMSDAAKKMSLALAKRSHGSVALLMQIHAGGVGLNLQEFDSMIFMSAWWTSALMDQAIARTVRMGQKKTVQIYNLVMAEELSTNIDLKILEAVETKRDISDRYFASVAGLKTQVQACD